MRCVSRQPNGPLRSVVASVWYFESEAIAHARERILPSVSQQVLVNLSTDELRWVDRDTSHHTTGAAVGGIHTRPIVIDTAQQRRITGVSFVPGGASAFFGPEVQDYQGSYVPLKDLSGLKSLREQLLEASSKGAEFVISVWMKFLALRLKEGPSRRIQRACGLLSLGNSVQAVADELSISTRSLRRDFAGQVGVSPKNFARIQRMQRLSKWLAKNPKRRNSLAELAVRFGYFDQAHMTHEFQKMAGVCPTQYAPRTPDDWNHTVI